MSENQDKLEQVREIVHKLHTDWEVGQRGDTSCSISRPGVGHITLDWKLHNFEMGLVVVRTKGPFKGVKWLERLTGAAVRTLAAL